MSYFGAPTSGRTHASMHLSLGVLAALGIQNLSHEWSETLSVWSYGEDLSLRTIAPRACIAVAGLAAIAFAIGWRWRVAGALLCASMALAYVIAPVTYHNNLYVLWLMVLLTLLASPAEYRPADLFRDGLEPSQHDALLPVIARWQVAIVYIGSVFVKATHPMWQGTGGLIRWLAAVRVPEVSQGIINPLVRPIFSIPLVASVGDVVVEGAEVIIPLMLFAPRLRRVGIACGVALHAFMQVWLSPQLFGFLMMWAYYAFVPAGDRSWQVTWSSGSRFDAALMKLFRRVDWMGRTVWKEGADLTLTDGEGRRYEGVAALRTLTILTPVTLLAFATMSLAAPGMRQVFTVPREALENVVLLVWASLWVPGLWGRTLRWVRSQPSRTQR